MEVSQARYILTEALLLWFPVVVLTVDTGIRGSHTCDSAEDCKYLIGKVACDKKHQRCYCTDGLFELPMKNKCVSIASIGEPCEVSEQCRRSDANSVCSSVDNFRPDRQCHCRPAYEEEEEVDGRKKCIASRRSSFLMGSPHFDSGDTVPIAMGCLAAGLALLACCAGIVQLISFDACRIVDADSLCRSGFQFKLRCCKCDSCCPHRAPVRICKSLPFSDRKKNSSRGYRWSDSQHPHESLVLSGFTTSQMCADRYTSVCITGVTSFSGTSPVLIPSSPSPLPPEDDLPPSYEEAVKQMAPYLPVTLSQSDKI